MKHRSRRLDGGLAIVDAGCACRCATTRSCLFQLLLKLLLHLRCQCLLSHLLPERFSVELVVRSSYTSRQSYSCRQVLPHIAHLSTEAIRKQSALWAGVSGNSLRRCGATVALVAISEMCRCHLTY